MELWWAQSVLACPAVQVWEKKKRVKAESVLQSVLALTQIPWFPISTLTLQANETISSSINNRVIYSIGFSIIPPSLDGLLAF
jgi:hypothetical protein